MKKVILVTGVIGTLLLASCQPNVKGILKKSYAKCQSIKNGSYQMTMYLKAPSRKDTSVHSFDCYFKKLPNDSIYSFAFNNQGLLNGKPTGGALYTGNDFVSLRLIDSTGEIMSNALWAKRIKANSFQSLMYLYQPLMVKNSFPFPFDSTFKDKYTLKYLGLERINDFLCYHIKMNIVPKKNNASPTRTLSHKVDFWINKNDYVPVQYSTTYEWVMKKDTMYQFGKKELTKYELNNLKDDKELKLSSIPSYVKLKEHVQYVPPKLLPNHTRAPKWSLKSTKGKTVNLSDFKGNLVLIDFFFKSCYPCMLALPGLQNLNEKYSSKGLHIIGIDPVDTKKDNLNTFLSKQGITYTVLFGGHKVTNEYHISGCPTMYLINKEGKIIFSQMGYSKGTEEKLVKVIKKNL